MALNPVDRGPPQSTTSESTVGDDKPSDDSQKKRLSGMQAMSDPQSDDERLSEKAPQPPPHGEHPKSSLLPRVGRLVDMFAALPQGQSQQEGDRPKYNFQFMDIAGADQFVPPAAPYIGASDDGFSQLPRTTSTTSLSHKASTPDHGQKSGKSTRHGRGSRGNQQSQAEWKGESNAKGGTRAVAEKTKRLTDSRRRWGRRSGRPPSPATGGGGHEETGSSSTKRRHVRPLRL